jgi:hypothetical protein
MRKTLERRSAEPWVEKKARDGACSSADAHGVGVRKALRPEPRDKFLDAATRGAHEDALFLCRGRGREVHVAIDLGHRVASTFGRAEVISPEAEKSTLGWR